MGTGGTLTGVSEYIKARSRLKAIAVEPTDSPCFPAASPGRTRSRGSARDSCPRMLKTDLIDEIVQVTNDEAIAMARRLPHEEGMLVGISSGAAVHAA